MDIQIDTITPVADGSGAVSFQGNGSLAQRMIACGFKTNALRGATTMPNPELMKNPAIADAASKLKLNYSFVQNMAMTLGIPAEVAVPQNQMHTNAVLRWYEWQSYDTALLVEALRPMRAVAAMRSAGLTHSIGNGLGKTVLMYEDVSFLGEADMSMDAESQRGNDRVEFTQKFLPLPIIHKSWFINARTLAASRETGESLDTTQAAMSGRKIGEYIESMTLLGSNSYAFGGGTVYGLTDFPTRQTGNFTADWATASPKVVLKDILAMVQKAQADYFYGPYLLFISGNCESAFSDDYSSNYGKSLLNRIKETQMIKDVVFCPFLNKNSAATQAVLFQATPDVARLVDGMPLTNVQWEEQGNMRFHFKGMQICLPQIRATQGSNCGVVHYTVAT